MLLAFCEILKVSNAAGLDAKENQENAAHISVRFESILTFLKSQGKEGLELGKVDPGYLCVKMQCISCAE